MATKAELAKAYDGGQAAQAGGFSTDGNPFEEGSDEYEQWIAGFEDDLAEKWTSAARTLTKEISN